MTHDISALMDGELDPDEAGRLLGRIKQDDTLREAWTAYHLIGDSLRNSGPLDTDISARIAQRLAAEPTILAPGKKSERRKRFPVLALAASVSAFGFVSLLAWQVVRIGATPAGASAVASAPVPQGPAAKAPVQLAAAPVKPVPAAGKEPAKLKFSAVAGDSYLLAHQEFSPSYAVAGMPAYVRTVTEQDNGQ